jgi:hypothetical protein
MDQPQVPYDPALVAPGSFQLFHELGRVQEQDTRREYARVQLTAAGNEALRLLCHMEVQREVWSWQPYPFLVRVINGELCVKAAHVSYYST